MQPDEKRSALRVGVFVAAAILAAAAVILLLGRRRHVFVPRATLHALFTEVSGLRVGAPVWLSGVNVGSVTRVSFPAKIVDKRVHVELLVTRQMLERIRRDSTARIDSQGLLGDKIIEITIGSPAAPPLEPGDEIATVPPADIGNMLAQAARILEQTRVVADHAVAVSRTLSDPATLASVRKSFASLQALLARAEQGPGLAHALFYDARTGAHFETLAANLDRLTAHVDTGVRRLDNILASTDGDGKQIVNNVSRAAKHVGDAAADLKTAKMIANLERATADLADLVAYVRTGKGTIGGLIVDPTAYEQLLGVLGGVARSRMLRALVRYGISRDDGKRLDRAAGRAIAPR